MVDYNNFFETKPVVDETPQRTYTEFKPNVKKGQNGVYEAVVRFLPNPTDPANKSIIKKDVVYLENPTTKEKRQIDCPSTVGEIDPIKNTYFALNSSENPVLKENAKMFSRKTQYASLVQILSCKSEPALENKILVWKYGYKIHEKVQQELNPPMGEPKNPFNILTGRPFLVKVKEVGGWPNYDSCIFFDLPVEQSGMRIIENNASGQPSIVTVTPAMMQTPQAKELVFNYLNDNAPSTANYEYHAWDAATNDFVNECIRIYTNPQATIQAMSAQQVAPMQQMPVQQQIANSAIVNNQMMQPQQQFGNTIPSTQGQPIQMPTMPQGMPTMPQMGLEQPNINRGQSSGFSTQGLPADLADLLNSNNNTSEQKTASSESMIDLSSVML